LAKLRGYHPVLEQGKATRVHRCGRHLRVPRSTHRVHHIVRQLTVALEFSDVLQDAGRLYRLLMRSDLDLTRVSWHTGALNNGLIFGATYHGVTRLPRACSYAIGHVGTWLAYHLMRDGTRALVANLRTVQPDATERALRSVAQLTYRSYALDTIDFIRSLGIGAAQLGGWMAEHRDEGLAELRRQRRGVMVVSGHFGNWELGGVTLRLLSGCPVTLVGKSDVSPMVTAIRRRMRASLDIETLEIGQTLETALRIRSALAANRVVTTLIDRPLGRDRIDVMFFGRPTAFLRSPAMIGYLSGAPLLPAFMIRQADGRFIGRFGEAIFVDTSKPTDESVRDATQAFAAQLERQICAHPHLWYQFYPYWQSQVALAGR